MHLKIPEKFREGHQHGLFLLMTLGLIFTLTLGLGSLFHRAPTTPAAPGLAEGGDFSGLPPGSFILKPEDKGEANPLERKVLTLTGPALWQGREPANPTRMARLDRQYFYAATGAKTPMPDRLEVDLYRFSERPAAHLHVRQVDYNELGYGGGLKIALELIQVF